MAVGTVNDDDDVDRSWIHLPPIFHSLLASRELFCCYKFGELPCSYNRIYSHGELRHSNAMACATKERIFCMLNRKLLQSREFESWIWFERERTEILFPRRMIHVAACATTTTLPQHSVMNCKLISGSAHYTRERDKYRFIFIYNSNARELLSTLLCSLLSLLSLSLHTKI